MENLFGIEHLIQTENETAVKTQIRLAGNSDNLPIAIDTLFKILYFSGETEDVETPRGGFQSFCHTHYAQTGYTFWTIYNLYERGYYLEGIVLYRHLLEAFVQMRYFDIYPEKLERHVCAAKSSDRVTFKTMFDEFSEGLYHRYYARQLSEAAHGMVYKHIHRFRKEEPAKYTTVMGCQYNEVHATYLGNNMAILMFGYLNLFEKFFPNNTLISDEIVYKDYIHSKAWLERCMEGHRKINQDSEGFYAHINEFIYSAKESEE